MPPDGAGVAVVTGGSRGIGAATAVLLARRGWDVCVGYRSDAAAARRVVADCEATGGGVRAVSVPGAGGAIVNVSSAAARLGSAGEYVDYAASKAAVDTMTLGLAREVAAEGIRVNGVRPGLIDTEIHASGGRPNRVEQMRSTVPMQRGGRAEEVAAAIAWLCSDEAGYTTAAILDVSGGR